MSLSEEEKRGQRTPLCRTPTSELLQLAAHCLLSRPPSTEPAVKSDKEIAGPKSASQELKDLLSGAAGWWKVDQARAEGLEQTAHTAVAKMENEGSEVAEGEIESTLSADSSMEIKGIDQKSALLVQMSPMKGIMGKLVELKIPTTRTGKFLNRSSDGMSYDSIFRQELPLETSSVKSDSSTLSDKSQESPRKSPKKPRIAAKFSLPIDAASQ